MASGNEAVKSSDDDFIAQVQLAVTVVGTTPVNYDSSASEVGNLGSGLANLVNAVQSQKLTIEAARAQTAVKNAVRDEVEGMYRNLANGAHADPACTPAMLTAAGFTVPDSTRSNIPAPTAKPIVVIEGGERQTLLVRVLYPGHPKGGKPAGIANTAVLYFVGPTPPAALTGYTWANNYGKTRFEITLPASEATKTVWLVAVPLNAKGERGPMSESVSGILAA